MNKIDDIAAKLARAVTTIAAQEKRIARLEAEVRLLSPARTRT